MSYKIVATRSFPIVGETTLSPLSDKQKDCSDCSGVRSGEFRPRLTPFTFIEKKIILQASKTPGRFNV